MIGATILLALAAAVPIQATEYTLTMPARVPAGLTTFAFENQGKEPHYVRFVTIAAGHTMDDFVAWQKEGEKAGGAIPDWLVSSGGLGAIAPGTSEEVTLTLAAGTYVVMCTYPTLDGMPHLRKGMFAPLVVGPETSTESAPSADLTIRLHDHGFQLTAPIEGGR